MKLFTKTFGCQMNFADSDEMGRHFRRLGFSQTDNEEGADAILINTCTVRDLAEHKAVSYIGRLKEWKCQKSNRFVIVTGCAAERTKGDLIKRFPQIDLVVGATDIDHFPQAIESLFREKLAQYPLDADERALVPNENQTGSSALGFVTIMRGCNYSCSYCIVPSVRGREVYLPRERILADVQERVAEGAKEIWLLGQTVNSYRPNGGQSEYDFSDLLRDVAKVSGVRRLRFMSPHPFFINNKLVETMASTPQVCEHIHLPAQSGSNEVLKRMKRNYTRESYLANVKVLRKAIPGIAISTDLIVGFPGETDEDFQRTLSLVEEADFASAYCFKYSSRPGTESSYWEDDIPELVKEERVNRLLALTDTAGTRKAAAMVGESMEVLIENDKGNQLFRGRTRTGWRVRIQHPGLRVGDTVIAQIIGHHSRELHGQLYP